MINLGDLELLEMNAQQVDGKRLYETPTGEKYPSVTTVTGLASREHIKLWRERVGADEANKITAHATKRGTKMHELFETYLRAEEDVVFENIFQEQMFNAALPILDEIQPIALEAPLYSHTLKMAGRVDCVGLFEDKLCIIDFKTSGKWKEEYMAKSWYVQMTAYALMVEEMTGNAIEEVIAIVVVEGQTGGVQVFGSYPDEHVEDLVALRKQYENLYGV
jgi:ATP-dependent exoDNAse (exonuclease V) beta subunit|tara:strand:+ start:743 stop:1402 length:660 start_codon:yes stop_codon:yes gene_type:complete